jgi:quercetin dioxygenase-like cupin family protein
MVSSASSSSGNSADAKGHVTVVPFDMGERVKIGQSGFSNMIVTDRTTETNGSMLGYSVFSPGADTKQRIHVEAEKLAYIVSGSGKLTVGDKVIGYGKGDSLHIPAGVPHGIRNDGKEDLVMVFFFPTRNYPKSIDG